MTRVAYVLGREVGLTNGVAVLAPAHVALARVFASYVVTVLDPVQRLEPAAYREFLYDNVLGFDLTGRLCWRVAPLRGINVPQHYGDYIPNLRSLWLWTAWGIAVRLRPDTGRPVAVVARGDVGLPASRYWARPSGVRVPSVYYNAPPCI